MGISFDKGLGVHPQALQFRIQRSTVLASNLANVDTPGFKAMDAVFAFDRALENSVGLSSSDNHHMDLPSQSVDGMTKYRIPNQQTADGNTVELGIEQAAFARNTLDFQTSFAFLNMKFKGLDRAINGR
ncbi:flagellar basal body rod protein FlgB [Kistimonas asteriae]|uniref:flagellar basal body rod protein FlgB n=1 Tax=Kistimonas asteriae TaxID=517724 RepID=UPI001BAA4755|nr:flagellar basal body rod protein FlgB [Kistimonas asteriae]